MQCMLVWYGFSVYISIYPFHVNYYNNIDKRCPTVTVAASAEGIESFVLNNIILWMYVHFQKSTTPYRYDAMQLLFIYVQVEI